VRKHSIFSFLQVFLILSIIYIPLSAVSAIDGTQIVVINPATSDSNFIFYTNTTSVGARFNATVWGYDVPAIFAFQVLLNVDDTLLNVTDAWLPTWDVDYVFYGQATVQPVPAFRDNNFNGVFEGVLIADTLLVGTPATGDRKLAIIEFEIIYAPTTGSVSCDLDVNNADTFLLDYDTLDEIPVTKTSGNYEYLGPVPKPPTASFTYSPMSPLVNETVTFDASGSTPNGGAIGNYSWDFGDGNITSVSIPTITHIYTSAGDFNVTLSVADDEGFSDTTWQIITIYAERIGDLTGDGKIDIKDIGIAALAFGSFPGHPRWNPEADVDRDNRVSMKDIVMIASNFGKFV